MQPFMARSRQIGMTRNFRALLIASAAAVPLLAACSSSAMSAAGGTGAQAPRHALAAAPGAPVRAPTSVNRQGQFAPSLAGRSTKLTKIPVPSQSIIYTADLVLRVNNVTTVAALATGIVTGAGGYIAGEQENQQPGTTPQVSLTLKIPVAVYHATLDHLAGLGHHLAFSEHAVDVTQQVANVNSRVASAEAAIRQLRALLSRAGSIPALLSVQDQINSQESDLEALLAQQQALGHETSYATVAVVLIGHHPRSVKNHKKTGTRHNFVTGLSAGWHALGTAVSWTLTVLGAVLPFVLILALIAGIGLASRRRLTRRKAPPAATQPPAEAA
jgi:hypothetical protein